MKRSLLLSYATIIYVMLLLETRMSDSVAMYPKLLHRDSEMGEEERSLSI